MELFQGVAWHGLQNHRFQTVPHRDGRGASIRPDLQGGVAMMLALGEAINFEQSASENEPLVMPM